uniref:cupredoxin domain-containing protein n=1 Tax=Paenibacillus wynnii TaxID=268407 RepID=UPI003593BF6E
MNRDEIRHSATADDKSFNSELMGKDESKSFTFDKQGEISYFCIPHPGMKGTIIVKAD